MSGLSRPVQWLIDALTGNSESDSGVDVNVQSALSFPPVWNAVSKISGHVGYLPLNLHRRLDRGSEHAWTHPVYHLLKTRPNRYQTAIVFKEQMMVHALLQGNARAAIIRTNGVPTELIPLCPSRTTTCVVDGEKWHVVQVPNEDNQDNRETLVTWQHTSSSQIYKIRDRDVLHIPGLGYDGLTGRSLLSIARDSIGLGLAAQKATSRSFKNGSRPAVIIQAPQGVLHDDKDAKEFIDNFNSFHAGVDNTGKAGLLRNGMTIETMAVSAADAQWIQQRQFQRQDAALLFCLEHILGDDSSVSYNSLEQKNQAYLTGCLSKWLVKIEQECDYKLLNDRSRNKLYFKFNAGALLRADYGTTIDSLSSAIRAKIINPNEAREKLDMNPYDGGDEFINPAIDTNAASGSSPATETLTVEDANRSAFVSHLRHMIGVEAKQVLNAAGNKRNYIGWLDAFYSEAKWSRTLKRSVEEMGGDSGKVESHLAQSKNELIELAGTVSQDGLADAVAECVARWPDRAERLAHSILESETYV